ncbi:protein YAE1 homolog [Elgaria multicarinata webbii]|uniref:protein YAE1 homolog n=1 Tax=Elgaria multicarinata webbii TaxID=159646 RepID=UPI002FCD669B
MSWVRAAVNQHGEDVFDEEGDEMDVAQKEWKSTMEKRVNEGYREGVEAGKQLTLQQGFNQGYKEAVRTVFFCGQLKGTISALSSWCHHNGCKSTVLCEMTELLNELEKYEEYMLKNLNYTQPQASVGDLLETVEDLGLGNVLLTEEQCNGTTSGRTCENGFEFSGQCRNDSRTDSFQGECCRRTKEGTDSKRPTFAWLKERTVSIVEQLGLSPDIVEHIQRLQT